MVAGHAVRGIAVLKCIQGDRSCEIKVLKCLLFLPLGELFGGHRREIAGQFWPRPPDTERRDQSRRPQGYGASEKPVGGPFKLGTQPQIESHMTDSGPTQRIKRSDWPASVRLNDGQQKLRTAEIRMLLQYQRSRQRGKAIVL